MSQRGKLGVKGINPGFEAGQPFSLRIKCCGGGGPPIGGRGNVRVELLEGRLDGDNLIRQRSERMGRDAEVFESHAKGTAKFIVVTETADDSVRLFHASSTGKERRTTLLGYECNCL